MQADVEHDSTAEKLAALNVDGSSLQAQTIEDSPQNGHDVETQLLKLQQASIETSMSYWFGGSAYSALLEEFPKLWLKLSTAAMLRIRREFDCNLCFQPNGEHVDLRTIVFEDLNEKDRDQILARIQSESIGLADSAKFVALFDVDDTLLPGHDVLGISGVDRSWHTDGQLYPGVSRMCRELCGARLDDYPVLLTARPPGLLSSLSSKVDRLAGIKAPKMGILPGARLSEAPKNLYRVMSGEYTELKEVKVKRIVDYASLFPECAGRFVFIGDDGQGDFFAAEEMLDLRSRQDEAVFLMAFVAIKAVRTSDGNYLHSLQERHSRRERLLEKYPPEQADNTARWRFFYFDDYDDLASQLAHSGWISHEQALSVKRAAERDRRPCLLQYVWNLDLAALEENLASVRPWLNELDEIERYSFEQADAAYSKMSSSLRLPLWLPLDNTSVGVFAHIRLLVNVIGADECSTPAYISVAGMHSNGTTESVRYEGDGQVEIPFKVFQQISFLLVKLFTSSLWASMSSPLGCFFIGMPRHDADHESSSESMGKAEVSIWNLQDGPAQSSNEPQAFGLNFGIHRSKDVHIVECGKAHVQYSFHDNSTVAASSEDQLDESKTHRSCQECQTSDPPQET